MEVKTVISAKDFRKVAYFNTFLRTSRVTTAMSLMVVMFLLIRGIIMLDIFPYNPSAHYFSFLPLAMIPVMLLMHEYRILSTVYSKRSFIGHELVYNIQEDTVGVRSDSLRISGKYNWDQLEFVYEINDYYLIYVNEQRLFILPKRDIGGKMDLHGFLTRRLSEKFFYKRSKEEKKAEAAAKDWTSDVAAAEVAAEPTVFDVDSVNLEPEATGNLAEENTDSGPDETNS